MSTQTTRPAPEGDAEASFADRLATRLAGYGDRPCIEFERRWYTGAEVMEYVHAIARALERADVLASERIGVIVRNRVPHAAAVLGFVTEGRPVAMINSYQSARSIARDIEKLRPSAVIADRQDWTTPVLAVCERVRGYCPSGAVAPVAKSTVAKLTVASAASSLSGSPRTSTWTTMERLPAWTTFVTARAAPPVMARK